MYLSSNVLGEPAGKLQLEKLVHRPSSAGPQGLRQRLRFQLLQGPRVLFDQDPFRLNASLPKEASEVPGRAPNGEGCPAEASVV